MTFNIQYDFLNETLKYIYIYTYVFVHVQELYKMLGNSEFGMLESYSSINEAVVVCQVLFLGL